MLLSHRDEQLDVVGDVVTVRSESGREQRRKRKMAAIMWSAVGNSLRRLTNFIIFLFTAYVGIVKPSVSNATYFIAFLLVSSWWATYTPLRHGVYNQVKKFLIFYSAVHFLVIYTYQIPMVHQSWLPTGSFLSRLFGLNVLMDSSCPDWWKFPFVAPDFDSTDLIEKWPLYANPIVVLVSILLVLCPIPQISGLLLPDGRSVPVHSERFPTVHRRQRLRLVCPRRSQFPCFLLFSVSLLLYRSLILSSHVESFDSDPPSSLVLFLIWGNVSRNAPSVDPSFHYLVRLFSDSSLPALSSQISTTMVI